MDSPPMSCLSTLPDEVLKLIMQHVPLPDRLSSCCLVSTRMHAAAVAATESLSVGMSKGQIPPYGLEDVLAKLSRCGQHLTALSLSGALRELPCPDLLELTLTTSSVQLGAADGYPGVLQVCTKLTRLELWWVDIDTPEGAELASLSSLVHLQHLVVMPGHQLHGFCEHTLPTLHNLTHLQSNILIDEDILQLSGLTNLQELLLMAPFKNVMWDAAEDTVVGPRSVPGLKFPECLKALSVSFPIEAELLTVVPAELQRLWVFGAIQGVPEGPGSFLSCMARLQHLTSLSLHPEDDPYWPPAGPAYSALTASSKLVQLEICDTSFPRGVWPYMFPASRKLSHLTALELRGETDYIATLPWCSASDLGNLVSCCPSLCAVGALWLQHGLHVSELHKLTALTRLRVHYYPDDPDCFEESMRGLAAVNRLQDLEVLHVGSRVKVASLLPLTNLTALTKFQAHIDTADRLGMDIRIPTKTQGGKTLDVWLQLLQRCAAEAGDQQTALATLAQQLGEQWALTARQEKQIAGLQQQVSDQQQLIAGMLERVLDLLPLHQQ